MTAQPIIGNIDLAQIALYAFWVFFAGLIYYLRREDRREGYPLESDATGKFFDRGVIWLAPAKTFTLAHGGTVSVPNAKRDTRSIAAVRAANFPGAPLIPSGNPMKDGVGPASFAERAHVPDKLVDGKAKIVPLRVAKQFEVAHRDPDPRGMQVIGADDRVAGTISDAWVDQQEHLIRYLEVETGRGDTAKKVLLPINFARIVGHRRVVEVHAITAEQFADVPALANADQVTLLEEDKICGYYGGGMLYAMPERAEPMI